MSASATSAPSLSFFQRHEFLLRRLHSLSGLVPVGAYMVVHLLVNASLIGGASVFQKNVFGIHGLPLLVLVEWVFIFLPIIFHAVVGIWIAQTGRSNLSQYPLSANRRYTYQRITGYIAFIFIFFHVFHMHGWFHGDWWLRNIAEPFGMAQFRPYNAASSLATAMASLGWVWPIFYTIGMLACVFHLANGIWTAGITWGVWLTPRAQRNASVVCAVFGVFLGLVGLTALFAAKTTNVSEAEAIENEMYEAGVKSHMIVPNEHKRTGDHRPAPSPQPEPVQ